MSDQPQFTETTLTAQDYTAAHSEVSFLLDVLVRSVQNIVGGSTPAVGTSAGRHMGRKLPIYLDKPDLDAVLTALEKHFAAGFEASHTSDGAAAEVTFARCALRDVCKARKLELGGDLCKMFHYFHAGMAAELVGKPVRVTLKSFGQASCVARLQQ